MSINRLNLNADRLRADVVRTTTAKDDELAELRAQHARRIQAYEEQLNDLTDANGGLQRQIRLFETRSRQFETQSQHSFESNTHNYRREYRKTLALLRDSRQLLAMERAKSEKAPATVRRLRLQLEEAEAAKLSALRSKCSLESDVSELNIEVSNSKIFTKSMCSKHYFLSI